MKKICPADLLPLATRTGRWSVQKFHGQPVLYTTNLGSYLRCLVTASRNVTINVVANQNLLSPSQVWAVRIDQQDWQRFPAKQGRIKLQLSPQAHIIEIMAAGNTDLDEVWAGKEWFALSSIELSSGKLRAAPGRPLVNFIGDSITAGCWVAGKHAAYDYRPETNYVGTCADRLQVDSVRIAYSAGGVLRPATGGVPTADRFLSKIDADTPWVPNQPQVTVVNLGVNDRRFSLPRFVNAYDRFLQQVKQTFPQTKLVVMIPFSQTFASPIRHLAAKHHGFLIETADWCPSFTDGLHPDQAGALVSGQKLAKVLRPFFGQSSVQ